ncbi:Slp family lipoprotein [Kangiella sediminilitoris]|uniref:Outer membrane lipoprotein, Slp family n=1 Tax=Kangiella sediminilitoris TaxID=1144748 RepID=A0A1B3BB54_9GAMM|nr:Slp family lipoprotein [Kangiella sediminilitoris]AOE50022.1 Outer membrane lipoprotein, Slp family [Kangiella sediminilitoris]
MSYLFKVSLVLLSAGMLFACASTPQQITFEQENIPFTQVAQNPEGFTGREVRWGGIVARVENLENDTLIEVVNLPLGRQARPVEEQQTGGRFIARVPGFLDPMIYDVGKEITVVGKLSKPMPGKVGKHKINFPVVDTRGHHLWKKRPQYEYVEVYSAWDPYWFYHRPYYWPYNYRYRVIRPDPDYERRRDYNRDAQDPNTEIYRGVPVEPRVQNPPPQPKPSAKPVRTPAKQPPTIEK